MTNEKKRKITLTNEHIPGQDMDVIKPGNYKKKWVKQIKQ